MLSAPMPESVDGQRRRILGIASATIASAMLAPSDVLAAAAPAAKLSTFANLKQIEAGDLTIGYAEAGPANGVPVILLHGWPYDIHTYVDVAPLLAAAGYRVIVPYLRGYGTTRFRSDATARNGQQAVIAVDIIALMDALKIGKAVFGGCDWGARTACIIAAIWPERCQALVSVSGYLIGSQAANAAPLPPKAELAWWYQFYFATPRGEAGYAQHTRDFNRLIWQLASPRWKFDDAVFERSAKAFDNPDHVAIVIHNYRWRLGLAPGEARYDELERQLAASPPVTVPTITLEGDANGAPHPDASQYAARFTGRYAHRSVTGGIGHNLPQEAPRAFADAVMPPGRSDIESRRMRPVHIWLVAMSAIVPVVAGAGEARAGKSPPSRSTGSRSRQAITGSFPAIRFKYGHLVSWQGRGEDP